MILLDSMWHIKKKRHLAAVPNACREGVEEITFPGFPWSFSAIPVAEVVQTLCKTASVCAEVRFNMNFIWNDCDGGNILVLSKTWKYLRGLVLDRHSRVSGKDKDKMILWYSLSITESWNNLGWEGPSRWSHSKPCHGQGHLHYPRSLQTPSNHPVVPSKVSMVPQSRILSVTDFSKKYYLSLDVLAAISVQISNLPSSLSTDF